MSKYKKALLFYNDKSGQSDSVSQIKLIQEHFTQRNINLTVETIPKPTDEIQTIITKAKQDHVDLIIAAGGDGSVSMIASPLVKIKLPLGILPIGTGNLLSKEINIPQKLELALEVLTDDESQIHSIDVFEVQNRYYVLNISAGISSKVMKTTNSSEKKMLGVFAYLFHFIQQLLGLKLLRFEIDHDGFKSSYLASEVLVTNGRLVAIEPLEWDEDVSLNDGKLDLFIIRAVSFVDIVGFVISIFSKRTWQNPIVKYIQFEDYCRIATKEPIPAQADGDSIGKTPLEIRVVPNALSIIVPKN